MHPDQLSYKGHFQAIGQGLDNSFENHHDTLSNNGHPLSPRMITQNSLEATSSAPMIQSGAGTVAHIDMRDLINVRESFLKKQHEEECASSDKDSNNIGKYRLLMMIEGGQENFIGDYSGEQASNSLQVN